MLHCVFGIAKLEGFCLRSVRTEVCKHMLDFGFRPRARQVPPADLNQYLKNLKYGEDQTLAQVGVSVNDGRLMKGAESRGH